MHRQDSIDLAALEKATGAFTALCSGINDDQWGIPTTCTDWTLAQLVDHVTGGNRFTVRILQGEPGGEALEGAIASFSEAHEPGAAAVESIREQRAAFEAPGALDRTCSHIGVELSGFEVLRVRLHELIIHTWDVAESLDPPAAILTELVTWALAEIVDPESRTATWFGLEPLKPGRAPQEDLLAAFGRLSDLHAPAA